MRKFNIFVALNNLIPGAKFRGSLTNNTHEEYDIIEQLDPRDKPLQTEIFNEGLCELRRDIKDEINTKTDYIIEYGMYQNDGTNTVRDTFYYVVNPSVNVQTMPANSELGINYINDTTVRLRLYAPNKGFVYVIGDFNNWQLD